MAGPSTKDRLDAIQCEAACWLAAALGFDGELVELLAIVFERWDGKGVPGLLHEGAVDLRVRIAQVAHDMVSL